MKEEKKEEKKEDIAMVEESPKEEVKTVSPAKTTILPTINEYAEEVVFAFDKAELDDEGLAKLDDIAKLMKENSDMKLNIIGHTCNKGEADYNKILAEKRAVYTKKQLIKRGVNPESINEVFGIGENDALYNNQDLSTKRKNRTIRFQLAK